jgi:hypothetical protein
VRHTLLVARHNFVWLSSCYTALLVE